MVFVPLGFLFLLLRILAWMVAAKKKKGSPTDAPASPPAKDTLANLGALLLHVFVLYPLALLPAIAIADWKLSDAALLTLVPAASCAGLFAATFLPHWLAWRLLGPSRAAPLGRFVLRTGLFARSGYRAAASELYKARFLSGWDRRIPPASPWTIAAVALQAESEGNPARADALFGLLGRSSKQLRYPGRARTVAAEALAGAAARRGEWERVRARAVRGGRGTWFLSRLAALQLDGPDGRISKPLLILTWALAPGRIAAYPWLRSALAAEATLPAQPPASEPGFESQESQESQERQERQERQGSPGSQGSQAIEGMAPALAHLHLLARAAAGLPVTTGEVETLARAWAEESSPAAGADLIRRGLALGGQNLADLPERLRQSIFAELEILAEVAQGAWSSSLEAHPENDPAAPLSRSRVHRAFEDVEEEVDAFGRRAEPEAKCRPFASPLEELERWLDFRARVERLERIGGEPALTTAWHNGLRIPVCNWPIYLYHQRGAAAGWTAFLMDGWSIELATRMGDEEILGFSSKNAERIRSLLP
jgi:hypothetical protein